MARRGGTGRGAGREEGKFRGEHTAADRLCLHSGAKHAENLYTGYRDGGRWGQAARGLPVMPADPVGSKGQADAQLRAGRQVAAGHPA